MSKHSCAAYRASNQRAKNKAKRAERHAKRTAFFDLRAATFDYDHGKYRPLHEMLRDASRGLTAITFPNERKQYMDAVRLDNAAE